MYANDETFAIGKAKVVRKSDKDAVLVIAAGITMDQAVDAAAKLGRLQVITIEIWRTGLRKF